MSLGAPLFILGTGPGVGKTLVGCGLLTALGARDLAAVGIKPVETGCPHDDSHDLVGVDGDALRAAAPTELPPLVSSPYRFAHPVSPLVAAARAGLELTVDDLGQAVHAAHARGRAVVEGPGGPMCPIAADGATVDLAAHLGAATLIVAADRPCADGEVLLTLESCARRGVRVRGVLLSHRDADGTGWANETAIRARSEVPLFDALPTLGDDPVARTAAHLEASGVVDALLK